MPVSFEARYPNETVGEKGPSSAVSVEAAEQLIVSGGQCRLGMTGLR